MSAESEPVTKGHPSKIAEVPFLNQEEDSLVLLVKPTPFSVGWVCFLASRSGHSLSLGLSRAV